MENEIADPVLSALNDVALDYGLSDEELITLIAANLGRLIVHSCEGEPERLEHMVREAVRQISGAIKDSMPQ